MRYADCSCTYTEVFEPEHGYLYKGNCVISNKPVEVFVPSQGLHRYRCGDMIQDAFPDMPPADREFLLSGISDSEFDAIFDELDDPEEGVECGG